VESILSGAFALMDRLLPFAFTEPAFMKRALLALLFTAPAAAAIGVPLVQHRMAFFSDAIGHSAFTGVALGILLGVSPSWTMVAFGVLVAVAITLVKGRTELSSDTVIGVFFSTVVALGIAIISREKGLTRNLQAFLYGDPLAVTDAELLWMAALPCSFPRTWPSCTTGSCCWGSTRDSPGRRESVFRPWRSPSRWSSRSW